MDLVKAIEVGDDERARELVNSGVDVTYNNNEAIVTASKYDYHEIIESLIKEGADIHARDEAPLYEATINNNPEAVEVLFNHGVNVNNENVKEFFIIAAEKGYNDVLLAYINHGMDIKVVGGSALYASFYADKLETVKLLLKHGADIYQDELILSSIPLTGKKSYERFKFLIEQGVNVDPTGELLASVINAGSHNIAKLLIENNYKINAH